MTSDQLLEHRLKQLEDGMVGARSTERDVDLLKIESATLKGMLVEVQTEMRGNDQHTRASLARIHARLDEITTADARETGREAGEKQGRSDTLKLVGWTVMATIGGAAVLVALVVGVLTLALN